MTQDVWTRLSGGNRDYWEAYYNVSAYNCLLRRLNIVGLLQHQCALVALGAAPEEEYEEELPDISGVDV